MITFLELLLVYYLYLKFTINNVFIDICALTKIALLTLCASTINSTASSWARVINNFIEI